MIKELIRRASPIIKHQRWDTRWIVPGVALLRALKLVCERYPFLFRARVVLRFLVDNLPLASSFGTSGGWRSSSGLNFIWVNYEFLLASRFLRPYSLVKERRSPSSVSFFPRVVIRAPSRNFWQLLFIQLAVRELFTNDIRISSVKKIALFLWANVFIFSDKKLVFFSPSR